MSKIDERYCQLCVTPESEWSEEDRALVEKVDDAIDQFLEEGNREPAAELGLFDFDPIE